MLDPSLVILVSLLNVGIAAAVAYVLYRAIAPNGRSRKPLHTARRATAYTCVVNVLTILPKLFHARALWDLANAYAVLILNLVVWGFLAFILGWLVGKLFLKYEKSTDASVQH
jgi:hypothetical protein